MNNTAKQLIEQLGDSTEITIMSDIVYGLSYEYEQLLKENQELKIANKLHRKKFKQLVKDNHKLVCKLNILTEFEKWLAKQKKKLNTSNDFDRYARLIIIESLNKLQELKEGKK